MNNRDLMLKGKFGLEKENLRVDSNGRLSGTKHPSEFGESNIYITRDFSESQIEMVTPPCDSIEEAYDFLTNIQSVVEQTLTDEYLWPQSNPPILPDDEMISIADYNDENKKEYRSYLNKKYGSKRSVISGIHLNMSFDEEYIEKLYRETNSKIEYNVFKNALYLKIAKYFLLNRWLMIYLLAAGPIFHSSYIKQCVDISERTEDGDCSYAGLRTLRNSVCGYRNEKHFTLDFSTKDLYEKSVMDLIINKEISTESELYSAVRARKDSSGDYEYLELRFIDINPLYANGVSINDLKLLHLFMVYFASMKDFDFTSELQTIASINQDSISRIFDTDKIVGSNKEPIEFIEEGEKLLNDMQIYFNNKISSEYDHKVIIEEAKMRLVDQSKSYSTIIKDAISSTNYIDYHMNIAKILKDKVFANPTHMKGLEGMELSTTILIQSAIKKGLEFEVIDRAENFLRIRDIKTNKTEYIKEATKTSLDNYSSVLMMENKKVTKMVLDENAIKTPQGYSVSNIEHAVDLLDSGKLPERIVIKPNNTNFGIGITIFENMYTREDLIKAIELALKEDETVLLEEFIPGKEYRFLIIDGIVQGILFRRAASVLGDGMNTISKLVEIKNQNPLRGHGYTKPLEQIKIDNTVVSYLSESELMPSSIPDKDQRVYLRKNSNISTGGDSIDVTELIHPSYIEVAEKAARAMNVSITGVDMIIFDYAQTANMCNYAIIEMNFNPAIHIHCFPYKGTQRKIGDTVLDAIFG